jgi:hypothetical protein
MTTIEGDLRHLPLPRVLQRVAALGRNGILTLQGEDDIVAVSFLKGAVVTADALNQTVEDGLGKVLQSQGLVRPEDFAAIAKEYQGGSAGSLGEMLVQRGMIDRAELLDALRTQTFRQMLQLLTWRQGELRFYPGDEVSYEQGFAPISVDELLVRAIERLGDKAALPGEVPEIDVPYRRIPPRGPVQVLDRDGDGAGLGIWLTEAQANFLARLDGHRSAVEVGRELGFERFKTQFAVYTLLYFDLIESAVRTGRGGDRLSDSRAGLGDGRATGRIEARVLQPGTPVPLPTGLPLRPDTRPGLAGPGATPLSAPVFAPTGTGAIPIPAPAAEPVRPDTGVTADLRAEIFLPPDPSQVAAARVAGTESTAIEIADLEAGTGGNLLRWIGPSLAALILLGVGFGLFQRPAKVLLPLPWYETPRTALERNLRQSLYQDLDRQARSYFLMTAHFPDSVEDLTASGLFSEGELRDPAGFELTYRGQDVGYAITVQDGGETVEGLGTTEAITGDFLLDPQFIRSAAAAESPLVFLE